jgi:regulator of nonsense transcripts 3
MSAGSRRPQERLKLSIRLLPPGLTEDEFKSALGREWLVGGGKVDWMEFGAGKIAKNPAKHSKPATVWLHLVDSSHIVPLETKIRSTSFVDAKNSTNDPMVAGGPLVEFALNQKIPSSKKRPDPRMGTIDQDPDFIKFLESLTNPIQKPSVDIESSLNKEDTKVTSTPLIDHLREKKAAKEAKSSAKSTKEARDLGKSRRKGKDVSLSTSSTEKSKKSAKGDRAAKQAVKVLTRQVNTASAASSSGQPSDKSSETSTTPRSERRRERGGPLNIAAKIQRDLGLTPSSPRRAAKAKAATTDTPANSTTGAAASKEQSPPASIASSSTPIPEGPKRGPRGSRSSRHLSSEPSKDSEKPTSMPIILKKPLTDSSTPAAAAPSSSQPPTAPTGTISSPNSAPNTKLRVFLKHANPSQGITEPLLATALAAFGPIRTVEIDKRKGIAHADFTDATGLAAAITAGKVDVANGTVQILPFRERGPAPLGKGLGAPPGRGGRGRGGRRGGGGMGKVEG